MWPDASYSGHFLGTSVAGNKMQGSVSTARVKDESLHPRHSLATSRFASSIPQQSVVSSGLCFVLVFYFDAGVLTGMRFVYYVVGARMEGLVQGRGGAAGIMKSVRCLLWLYVCSTVAQWTLAFTGVGWGHDHSASFLCFYDVGEGAVAGTLFFSVSNALIDFSARTVPISAVRTLVTTRGGKVGVFVTAKHPGTVVGGLSTVRSLKLVSNCVAVGKTCYFINSRIVCGDTVLPNRMRALTRVYRGGKCPYVFIDRRGLSIYRPGRLIRRVFCSFLRIGGVPIGAFRRTVRRRVFRVAPFVAMRRRGRVRSLVPGDRSKH